MLHALPKPSSLTWLFQFGLAKSATYKAPHFAGFNLYFNSLRSKCCPKFRAYTELHVNYSLVYFSVYVLDRRWEDKSSWTDCYHTSVCSCIIFSSITIVSRHFKFVTFLYGLLADDQTWTHTQSPVGRCFRSPDAMFLPSILVILSYNMTYLRPKLDLWCNLCNYNLVCKL
jgi:hypothetical protein